METYYKWLLADRGAPLGTGKWTPGRWRSVKGELILCQNGLHLCRERDLLHHISDRLWIAEADTSEMVVGDNKVVVRRARIVSPVETINDCTLRLFACDCAERVAHLSNNPICKNIISVSRRFARGQATNEEQAAARAAATDAATDWAAWDAAWAAAWAAAWPAAMAAAAARDAAMPAARAAARDAETKRLLQYIRHGKAAEAMPWE